MTPLRSGRWHRLEARFERRPDEVHLPFGDLNSLLIGRSGGPSSRGYPTAALDFVINGVPQFPQLGIVEVFERTG